MKQFQSISCTIHIHTSYTIHSHILYHGFTHPIPYVLRSCAIRSHPIHYILTSCRPSPQSARRDYRSGRAHRTGRCNGCCEGQLTILVSWSTVHFKQRVIRMKLTVHQLSTAIRVNPFPQPVQYIKQPRPPPPPRATLRCADGLRCRRLH